MKIPNESLIRNILHPLWARWREPDLYSLWRECEETQHWSLARIQELQWRRLREIIRFAFDRCPYYRHRFQEVGFHPEDLREPKDMLRLPVLTRDDIRRNQEGLTARGIDPESYTVNFTGGSTGSPVTFKVSRSRWTSRRAIGLRHNHWTGWRIGKKLGIIWGQPYDQAASSLKERVWLAMLQPSLWLNTSTMQTRDFERFAAELDRRGVRYLQAYSRSLLMFARYLHERGLEPPPLEAVITTAECISEQERDFIRQTLDCKLFDRYGSREFSTLASECEAHEGLHIPAETLLLEFVVGNRPAKPSEMGKILVTDLLNEAMPLIRYQIGDVGAPLEGCCSCGRGLPRMQMIAGRVSDFIHTPEGKWISGLVINTYLLGQLPGIRQGQVIQETCDRLLLRLVPEGRPGSLTEKFLRQQIPKIFGPCMGHSVEWVDTIPPEASGKTRVTISQCVSAHGFAGSGYQTLP